MIRDLDLLEFTQDERVTTEDLAYIIENNYSTSTRTSSSSEGDAQNPDFTSLMTNLEKTFSSLTPQQRVTNIQDINEKLGVTSFTEIGPATNYVTSGKIAPISFEIRPNYWKSKRFTNCGERGIIRVEHKRGRGTRLVRHTIRKYVACKLSIRSFYTQ